MSDRVHAAAATVGYGVAAMTAGRVARFVWLNWLATADLQHYKKAGDWAVITGGSEGIGLAFAEALLLDHGFNVAIVALENPALDRAYASLYAKAQRRRRSKTSPPRQVLKIGFDFSAASEKAYEGLFAQLAPLEVGMLVNNVGTNYPFPRAFDAVPIARDALLLRVNCDAPVRMTKYVLPRMKQAKCGAIITMSSITASIPAGLLSTYAATKAFNAHFSRAIGAECAAHGIDCLAVAPNFIATRMSRRDPGFLVDTPADLASSALAQLGRTHHTAGGAMQNLIWTAYAAVPEPLLRRLVVHANDAVQQRGLASEAKRRRGGNARSKL